MKSLIGANQNCIPRNEYKFEENNQNIKEEILNLNVKQKDQNDKEEENQKKK
jgi:hypothetical protein